MREIVVALAVTGSLLPALAHAQSGVEPFLRSAPSGPPESGISLGVRAGYAIPMGALSDSAGDDLSKVIGGMIPLQVDAGWRFSPHWYAGGFFQYGVGMLNSDFKTGNGCGNAGIDCSASQMRFGVDVVYTVLPDAVFAPWIGLGTGYEMTKWSFSGNAQSLDRTVRGWEFAHLGVGADYRVSPWFRVGPFLTFALAQYSTVDTNYDTNSTPPTVTANRTLDIQQKALHEWLQFGIKGTFDL